MHQYVYLCLGLSVSRVECACLHVTSPRSWSSSMCCGRFRSWPVVDFSSLLIDALLFFRWVHSVEYHSLKELVCVGTTMKLVRSSLVMRSTFYIPVFTEPCRSTLHPFNFCTVVFLAWVPYSKETCVTPVYC